MTAIDSVADKLTEFVHQYLPTAVHMQISVQGYDSQSLKLHAPLAPSINDKGTAFGGSIYVVAVMACWGMVYLRCVEEGLEPDIVVAKADIEYLKPVNGDIVAQSVPAPEADWKVFFEKFAERGRAKMELRSEVVINGEVAARFSGLYAILGNKLD
ncbi:YiiD C-terminal domain-containing protein [Spongiibacter sp. KMU-158]|uniref:YiiD C-terminal domain-containing protein n=1 Tax=Spongiibacter pelagi TaxID=2760804 RepID=A0A927GWR9_9GAMM|nr:YiiD C-terminal domain-containing protein [Spongiibacter pelagi]MBD2859232.1 YiiD C-terminal domain-containing protein [Spongiibacter pelagi]